MSTFAEKLYNVLASARASAPDRVLVRDRWIAIVNEFADAERPLGKNGKAKSPTKTPINKMSEDDFLAHLKTEPSLAGVDIDKERGKCLFWCKAKGKPMSRMRLINWLNRADKTLTLHGRDADTRRADVQERSLPPPRGWADFMKEKQRQWVAENPNGGEPPGTYALEKGDFFGMPKSWRDECRKKLGDS